MTRKQKIFLAAFVFIAGFACRAPSVTAEEVRLKSGAVFEGNVVEMTGEYIRMDVSGNPYLIRYRMMEAEVAERFKKRFKEQETQQPSPPAPEPGTVKPPVESMPPPGREDLLPLAIGNRWVYKGVVASSTAGDSEINLDEGVPISYTIRITGKEKISGKEVFIKEMYSGNVVSLREYLSIEDGALLCHRREVFQNGTKVFENSYAPPEKTAQLGLEPGTQWTEEAGLIIEFSGMKEVETPVGTFQAYEFILSQAQDIGESHVHQLFMPGIGMVSELTFIKDQQNNTVIETKLVEHNIAINLPHSLEGQQIR